MSLQSFYTCPTDCDTDLNLPAIPAEQDCTSYDQLDSQICDLVIVPEGASNPFDFTTPTDPTLVVDGIDNSVTDNSKAKQLVGEGGIAEPEVEEQEYPKNKDKVVKRIYTLEMTFKNMVQAQYEFFQALQCGWTGFTFYYGNLAGKLFGDVTDGITPKSVDCVMPLGAARGDKQLAIVRITWEASGDPDRFNSPL